MTYPRISFIVPVRNDARRLQICLQAIVRAIGPGNRHEIVVVDNGSVDASGEVARRFGATVRVLDENIKVAELRNAGAHEASGDVLAFIDADNEIVAGWVVAAIESLRQPNVGGVGALYLAPVDGTWVQRAYGYLRGQARGQHSTTWLGSGNFAVWRHAFETVGGFDTALETCEDVDFCRKLRAAGLKVLSDARLKSVHHGDPETLSDLFASERWRGRDNVRVSLRSPVTFTLLPSAFMPIVDALMLAVAIGGVLIAIATVGHGLAMAGLAATIMAVGAGLRVLRIMMQDRAVRGLAILQVWTVVCVYNIGRALALVTPAPHRGARSAVDSSAS